MKTMWRMFGGVLAIGMMGAWAPMVSGEAGLQAQGEQASAAPRIGCFRGRPLPACKSFWIVEMQGYQPLAQTTRSVSYSDGRPVEMTAFESSLEWNVGHMVNVSPTFAIGGTLSVGPHGGSGIFTGLKARARHWLSQDLSLELAGGLLDAGGDYPPASGATADIRINIRDQGAFFVRWDGVSLSDVQFPDASYFDEGGFQQAISVGASAGSVPALIATGALGLGYVILLGIYLGDSS